ncbi:Artemin [Labeo rohita]|uniref:Artemin n=1 Tax=Labeo rohita TaxID=84645 RepID=A0ABQ8MX69_LABRO|nr:Artemin [Labeo rohita]
MSPSTEAVSTALQFFKSPVPQAPSARMLTAMMQETQSDCPTKTLLRALKHNQASQHRPRSEITPVSLYNNNEHGGSLVVAEESDQSNACHAISHRYIMSQETLAVAGDRSRFRAESEAAVGFAGMEELPLEAFPDAEEEFEEGSDSPWHGLFEPSVLVEDDQQPARWERSPRSPDTSDIQTKGARKKKKKKEKEEKKKKEKSSRGRHSSRDCRVEKREMHVRDLGMGFDSDEIVVFKFCVGSCQRSRGNYDLALRALLANGSLPKRTARKISVHPCCRPTGYEPVSFMDATTTWRTIKSLSAADCECVG